MTTPPRASSTSGGYLTLLRPANVATAFADVLAGAAAAGALASHATLWLLPATACLYAGGVVLNDYFDRRVDAIERPERPIPSGAIGAGAAATLGSVLLAAGVVLGAAAGHTSGVVAGLVVACVLLYDAWAKRHAFVGPFVMGGCRALNLVLGMTVVAGGPRAHAGLALLPLVYIGGVTMLSRGEVAGGKQPVARAALALVALVAAGAAGLALTAGGVARLWALAIAAAFTARVVPPYWRASADPSAPRIRAAVRTGVLSLVLLDAVIAAAYADIMGSLAVLATAVLAGALARLFAVT